MALWLSPEHKELLALGAWLDQEVAGSASQTEWDEAVAEYNRLMPIVAAQRKIVEEDRR